MYILTIQCDRDGHIGVTGVGEAIPPVLMFGILVVATLKTARLMLGDGPKTAPASPIIPVSGTLPRRW